MVSNDLHAGQVCQPQPACELDTASANPDGKLQDSGELLDGQDSQTAARPAFPWLQTSMTDQCVLVNHYGAQTTLQTT